MEEPREEDERGKEKNKPFKSSPTDDDDDDDDDAEDRGSHVWGVGSGDGDCS